MKNFIVTYLALLILFQGVFVNTNTLFEMNDLIADYQLHKTKYGDTAYSFLSKHFGDLKEDHKIQHHQDREQNKLPIQNKISNTFQTAFTIQAHQLALKQHLEINQVTSNFHYSDLFSTFEKQKIFQPPRFL